VRRFGDPECGSYPPLQALEATICVNIVPRSSADIALFPA
jgi:hypothetical protein